MCKHPVLNGSLTGLTHPPPLPHWTAPDWADPIAIQYVKALRALRHYFKKVRSWMPLLLCKSTVLLQSSLGDCFYCKMDICVIGTTAGSSSWNRVGCWCDPNDSKFISDSFLLHKALSSPKLTCSASWTCCRESFSSSFSISSSSFFSIENKIHLVKEKEITWAGKSVK